MIVIDLTDFLLLQCADTLALKSLYYWRTDIETLSELVMLIHFTFPNPHSPPSALFFFVFTNALHNLIQSSFCFFLLSLMLNYRTIESQHKITRVKVLANIPIRILLNGQHW